MRNNIKIVIILKFEDILNVKCYAICMEEISDHDIIISIINENERFSNSEKKEENKVTPILTLEQVTEYLSEIRLFFEAIDNCKMISNIEKIESCII